MVDMKQTANELRRSRHHEFELHRLRRQQIRHIYAIDAAWQCTSDIPAEHIWCACGTRMPLPNSCLNMTQLHTVWWYSPPIHVYSRPAHYGMLCAGTSGMFPSLGVQHRDTISMGSYKRPATRNFHGNIIACLLDGHVLRTPCLETSLQQW